MRILHRLSDFIARIGAEPSDSEDLRLQKTLLVSVALLPSAAGIVWGFIYASFGEWIVAAIPVSYTVLSLLNVAGFAWLRRFNLFRTVQLLLILLLPFLLWVALGSVVNSSAVYVWAFLCPVGALLFDNRKQALVWFGAYLGLLLLGAVLHPLVRSSTDLPAGLILLFFVLNIGALSLVVFAILRYFVAEKNRFFALLRREQDQSERLLLNVLPKEIAPILKAGNGTYAAQHEAVSILFADVVGFTPLSAQMSATEMLDLLNHLFSRCDRLVERHDLEKIRTIGDNYMVVSGAPRPRSDHAQRLAQVALEMLDVCRGLALPGDRELQLRIGINSGPVIAGVIGHTKFHYDVWGDAVNVASRMESHGVPGKIQIGHATYALIKDQFLCIPRGMVEVKGKGALETWFLEAARETPVSRDEHV
ncbi:MAG TPA: adenylate/guanylate cyclase domain-containing protein [Anaerolineales bacterium]|nr:adenylate/guanylate cyclase domain-containing protein [Anaerolineales bacterium]